MKKIFITTLAFLMAVTMGTSLAQIGPAGGGPVGPASNVFRGGTLLIPIKAAVTSDCTAPAYSYSTSGYDNTGVTDITGSENVNVCVNGTSIAAFNAATTVFTHVPTLPTQTANTVFAGPATGAAAAPTFRAVVDADVPDTITVSNYLPLAGGTMTGNLLFTDNQYDIGASGATRPRTGYFGTDVNVGGDVNITDDLSCNQATATTNALATTTADGVSIVNTTASTSGATVQVSPSLVFTGHSWDTGGGGAGDQTGTVKIYNKPTSGSTTTSRLTFVGPDSSYTAGGTEQAYIEFGNSSNATYYNAGTYGRYQFAGTASWIGYGATVASSDTLEGNGISTGGVGSFSSNGSNTAGGAAVQIRASSSLTTEGSRILTILNVNTLKSAIDKDGVYHQGYASGQVTDGVTPLTLTLVTAMDDDTIYDVTVGCQYIGYAAGATGTPNYYFSSVIGATLVRVDGVASEVGTNTTISHKESDAACIPCAVSYTNGATDTITVTFTQCHADADTANVKAWIMDMRKTNITAFTGVSQPAAN